MSPPVLTFSHLKRSVSIETVLNAEGLTTVLKQRGQQLVGPCPVHGGDNPHAFVLNLSSFPTGVSAGSCNPRYLAVAWIPPNGSCLSFFSLTSSSFPREVFRSSFL